MEDECGSGSVLQKSFAVHKSESKSVAGEKRRGTEFGQRSELGPSKRVKMRDLDSVLRSEENKEVDGSFLSAEETPQVTKGSETLSSQVAPAERTGKDPLPPLDDPAPETLDLKTRVCVANSSTGDGTSVSAHKLPFSGKHDVDAVNPRGFGWDLNAEDTFSSVNQDPFFPFKNYEHLKMRDASECGSTTGPPEEKDPMRVWKEMKQNGFLSSSHGGIPMPKPRGRKSKNDGLKKKLELAKREQIDRFAKIAAPSGLLNELNPGIINHVRNSKQVHSIIEALVKSEKLENKHTGGAQQTKMSNGHKDISERKDIVNATESGMNQPSQFHEGRRLNALSGSSLESVCTVSLNESVYLSSEQMGEYGEPSMDEREIFGKNFYPSHCNPDTEGDILALKLSSSTTNASENTSSFSNEDPSNLTSVSSLSVKAANIASQWLELLHQDIKGRLAALRRSKKRVRAVIITELPFLLSREFSSNQENDPNFMKNSAAGCSDVATVGIHQARWSALFDQMDKALSEEEKQLESWFNQVKEMQLHCERGLQCFQYNVMHGLQQLGALETDTGLGKADRSERELAIRAAAASIYSTCNFLLSTENLPFN